METITREEFLKTNNLKKGEIKRPHLRLIKNLNNSPASEIRDRASKALKNLYSDSPTIKASDLYLIKGLESDC